MGLSMFSYLFHWSCGSLYERENNKLTPPSLTRRLGLRTNRMEASKTFLAAQKAEQEYRARRQATIARQDVRAAKTHLGEASKQFRAGVAALGTAVRLMPAVMREKKVQLQEKREKERAERAEKLKKRKEEKAIKEEEERVKREEEEKAAEEAEAEAGEGGEEEAAPAEEGAVPVTAVV